MFFGKDLYMFNKILIYICIRVLCSVSGSTCVSCVDEPCPCAFLCPYVRESLSLSLSPSITCSSVQDPGGPASFSTHARSNATTPATQHWSKRQVFVYFLGSYVHEHMLGYIQEAKTSKEAGGNLKKIFEANTTACRLQQRYMLIASCTLKIKEICDSIGSTNVNIDHDEMVQICLSNLAPWFCAIRLVFLKRENPPSFDI